MLINTSFNVHEEPIVNRPAECAKALVDKRIDFVVTERAIYQRSQADGLGAGVSNVSTEPVASATG